MRLTAGENFYVVNLNTAQGYVKVGAMICYDREFPESARILMLKGAEIILVPNACPIEINRFSQLRTRAYENMVGIATANYPQNRLDCNGHSCAFDGIAYYPNGVGSRDMLILEGGENEEVCIVEFPLKNSENTEPTKYTETLIVIPGNTNCSLKKTLKNHLLEMITGNR